jgi:outer membrane protein
MRNLSFALLLAAALLAQPPAPGKLSLEDAESLALKNHPQVLGAQNEYSAMSQRIAEARSAYYPQLSGEVTGSQGNIGARIGAGYLSDSRLFNRFGDGIVLGQLLTDSGRTPNLVAGSQLQAGAAQQNVRATKYDVLLRVNQAYFGTLRAQALVRVADETVAARQTVSDQVTTMYNNKLKSEVDVAFANVELSRAKLMQMQAQEQVQAQFAELARDLGSQDAVAYRLTEVPMPPSPASKAEDLVQQALNSRPELASLKLNRDSAYKFERAERDLSLPNARFVAVGGYMPYIDQITLPRIIPKEYEGAAINVEIPVFNGGLFKARREEAHYRALEADQRLRDEAERIARDVRSAWADAMVAYQRIDVTAEMVRQATLARELAQQRYQLGLSNIVELTQALLNLTEAEVENVNAKYDYQSLYANLQYTIGALR